MSERPETTGFASAETAKEIGKKSQISATLMDDSAIKEIGLQITDADTEYGWFKVYQDGQQVAGGSGPLAMCRREADHYAAVYSQDGPVRVRVQRIGRRKA